MDWKTSDPFIRVGFVSAPNKAKLDKTLEQGAIGGVLYQSKVISSELACSFDTEKTVLGMMFAFSTSFFLTSDLIANF
jgi:hypothetical protein